MDISLIIIIIVAVIVGVIVIKFLVKSLLRLIIIVIMILGLGYYIFFVFGDNEISGKQDFDSISIIDIKKSYCDNSENKQDSLICICIIEPLYNDLKNRLSDNEILHMSENQLKLLAEITKSFNNCKDTINKKLKEHNAMHLFERFRKELQNQDFYKKIKKE